MTKDREDVPEKNEGKEPFESFYPKDVRKHLKCEAIYLMVILVISLLVIYLNWNNFLSSVLCPDGKEVIVFKRYTYFVASGMLGGITFGIKYFYRAVGRHEWEPDRIFWRIMSPYVAAVIAFIVGTMIDSGLMSSQKGAHGPAIVAIGFFSGYFADEAVGKMYDVAHVIFGSNTMKKDESTGSKNDSIPM